MAVYKLSTERLDRWKAWLTLNEIPVRNLVRDQRMRISDGFVHLARVRTDANGTPIMHTCECDGPGHLAKRIDKFDLLEMPGAWADVDLVSA
jgi:hypothetical protein